MIEWSLGLVPRDHIADESYPERIRMGLLTRTFTPELAVVVDEAGAREEGPRTTTSVSARHQPLNEPDQDLPTKPNEMTS